MQHERDMNMMVDVKVLEEMNAWLSKLDVILYQWFLQSLIIMHLYQETDSFHTFILSLIYKINSLYCYNNTNEVLKLFSPYHNPSSYVFT